MHSNWTNQTKLHSHAFASDCGWVRSRLQPGFRFTTYTLYPTPLPKLNPDGWVRSPFFTCVFPSFFFLNLPSHVHSVLSSLFPLLSHSRSSIYVSPFTAQARLTLGSLSEQCEVHIAFPRIIFFSSFFTPTHHIPPPPHSLSMFFFSPYKLTTLRTSPFFSLTFFFLFLTYLSFIATLSPLIPFW